MPSDLAKYYAAQANDLNARADFTRGAQTQQTVEQTGQIAPSAEAQQAATRAGTNLTNQQALTTAPLAAASIASTQANTANTQARTSLVPDEGASQLATAALGRQQTQDSLSGFGPTLGALLSRQVYPDGVSQPQGITKTIYRAKGGGVPGKAKGTDTVPAMLSPGEAVLNRGAAEHMGQGVIDHLNKLGLMRMKAQKEVAGHMKMIDAAAGSKSKPKPEHRAALADAQHFAAGTANVQQLMAALPGLMGGAGAAPAMSPMGGGGGAAPAMMLSPGGMPSKHAMPKGKRK